MIAARSNPRPAGRWKTVALCAVMVAVPALLPAQVSLSTVVDLAQRNSTAVRLAQADIDKAQAVLSETHDVLIPSLSFSSGVPAFPELGFTGSPPSIWSATVQSLVFSIPQKHYIDAAKAGLGAARVRLKDAREQVGLDTSSAYIELDIVHRELEAADQQQALAQHLIDIEQQRSEAGVDPLSELLQAKLTAANLHLAHLHLETRAGTLAKQLATLTGLPVGSITPDHASIPEIPQIRADIQPHTLLAVESARLAATAKQRVAVGDEDSNYFPQLSFFAQYNRNTTILNSVNQYFAKPLPTNNFSSGFAIQIPLVDIGHRAKAHESEADALRSTVEAEQAEHQNDVVIAELTGTLRELDAQAEVASLKQQIAAEQLKTVLTEAEFGTGGGTGAAAQVSPKSEQLSRIDERQKYLDSLDASFQLAKARLGLLRALGHIEDWLGELHKSQP